MKSSSPPLAHDSPEEVLSMNLKTSDYLLLCAAFVSFLLSIYLWFGGSRDEGVFVGIWVPSILAFGAYYRLATREG